MIRYISVSLISLLTLVSCETESTPTIFGTVVIPVVSECKDRLLRKLKIGEGKNEISWFYNDFTDELTTNQYPNLVGVVTINGISKLFDEERITTHYINDVLLSCYPTASKEFNFSEMSESFLNSVNLLRKGRSGKTEYLKFEKDKIIYLFNDK